MAEAISDAHSGRRREPRVHCFLAAANDVLSVTVDGRTVFAGADRPEMREACDMIESHDLDSSFRSFMPAAARDRLLISLRAPHARLVSLLLNKLRDARAVEDVARAWAADAEAVCAQLAEYVRNHLELEGELMTHMAAGTSGVGDEAVGAHCARRRYFFETDEYVHNSRPHCSHGSEFRATVGRSWLPPADLARLRAEPPALLRAAQDTLCSAALVAVAEDAASWHELLSVHLRRPVSPVKRVNTAAQHGTADDWLRYANCTALGSVARTQRSDEALHAFARELGRARLALLHAVSPSPFHAVAGAHPGGAG